MHGTFSFELIILFVAAATALENVRERTAAMHCSRKIVAAMTPSLGDTIRHNAALDREMAARRVALGAAVAVGKQLAHRFITRATPTRT